MPLILSETEIDSLLTMELCLEVLEKTFLDFGQGQAVNRPRTHTYTSVGPETFYNFKSMDGAVPRYGVHALRISSEVVQTQKSFGVIREEKLPLAQGDRYVGLVFLFDLATTELLAIMPDTGLQRMRVGATSGLAAKYLARPNSTRVGLFGTGWQAGPQLEALAELFTLEDVIVFSPNPDHLHTFVREMKRRLAIPVRAADNPREVVHDRDIVVCATNAQEPVFAGEWLEAGQHVNSLQAGELDAQTHERADRVIVRARDRSLHYVEPRSGELPIHTQVTHRFHQGYEAKMVELGKVMAGLETGRGDPRQITLFGGSGTGPSSGLGIQFAAVGKAVYDLAKAQGMGRSLPSEWFSETHHP